MPFEAERLYCFAYCVEREGDSNLFSLARRLAAQWPHVSAVRCSRVLAGALLSLHLGLIKQLLAMLHC